MHAPGTSPDGAASELLPARMLNEFTYCPRLFHLEWVQKEWAESADTVAGSFEHRRVGVSQLSVFGNLQITPGTMVALLRRSVPICHFVRLLVPGHHAGDGACNCHDT